MSFKDGYGGRERVRPQSVLVQLGICPLGAKFANSILRGQLGARSHAVLSELGIRPHTVPDPTRY